MLSRIIYYMKLIHLYKFVAIANLLKVLHEFLLGYHYCSMVVVWMKTERCFFF